MDTRRRFSWPSLIFMDTFSYGPFTLESPLSLSWLLFSKDIYFNWSQENLWENQHMTFWFLFLRPQTGHEVFVFVQVAFTGLVPGWCRTLSLVWIHVGDRTDSRWSWGCPSLWCPDDFPLAGHAAMILCDIYIRKGALKGLSMGCHSRHSAIEASFPRRYVTWWWVSWFLLLWNY